MRQVIERIKNAIFSGALLRSHLTEFAVIPGRAVTAGPVVVARAAIQTRTANVDEFVAGDLHVEMMVMPVVIHVHRAVVSKDVRREKNAF